MNRTRNYVTEALEYVAYDEIILEIENCIILNAVRKCILSGWPLKVCEELKPYKRKVLELSIEKGFILWGH